MSRPTNRPLLSVYRDPAVVARAHRAHAGTPVFGCPICARTSLVAGVNLRWRAAR
ncbi:MAG: hypothetical protein ACJ761_06560 [Chloroflexota bacterium]